MFDGPLAAQTVVRIGLSAPLTGPDAAFGQGMRLGAEQAVAGLNRAAGEADALAGPAYAAVELLAQARERARSQDGRKVAAVLRQGRFRTIQGETAFDAEGDLRSGGVSLGVWKRTPDGRLDYAGNEVAP